MKKTINFITGILAGIGPVVIAAIFGVLIFNEFPNLIGIIICLTFIVLGAWIGIFIFKRVQRNGIVDFLTVVNASPDLDNLEPTEGSSTKKRTPKELAELSHKNQNIFKGGTLKIFGDWHGEPYHNFMKILSINYDEFKRQMTIQFSQEARMLIDEPDHILESPSVLKILSAKKIKLEFQQKRKNSDVTTSFYKTYMVTKNKIETESNINWSNQKMDAAIGQDALIIFN